MLRVQGVLRGAITGIIVLIITIGGGDGGSGVVKVSNSATGFHFSATLKVRVGRLWSRVTSGGRWRRTRDGGVPLSRIPNVDGNFGKLELRGMAFPDEKFRKPRRSFWREI